MRGLQVISCWAVVPLPISCSGPILSNTFTVPEDGSLGEGFATHHSLWQEKRYDFIYTCGPSQ